MRTQIAIYIVSGAMVACQVGGRRRAGDEGLATRDYIVQPHWVSDFFAIV